MFLDTSFCIDLLREHNRGDIGPASRKLRSLGQSVVLLPVFVLCELRAGAELSANSKRELGRVENLANSLTVVYPDRSFTVLYGETVAYLQRQGTPIRLMDVLVGITAKAWGLPLLTKDIEHFERIPGLVVVGY